MGPPAPGLIRRPASLNFAVAGRPGLIRNQGFTLVELLATMVFAGILLPVIVSAFSLILATSDQARHQAEATRLAQMKLAEIKADTQPGAGNFSGDFSPDYPGYTWSAQWAQADTAGLWALDLMVQWVNRGRTRHVELNTFYYYTGGSLATADTTGGQI